LSHQAVSGAGHTRRDALSAGFVAAAAGAVTPSGLLAAETKPYVAGTATAPIDILNLIEIEDRAQKIIPPGAFDFIARGAGDEWTLRENRLAFDRRQISPHIYASVSHPDTRSSILGAQLATPLISPPTMGHGLVHASAEVGTVQGVDTAGALMTLSTLSNRSIEEVASASKGSRWFQLYQQADEGLTRELLQRARAAEYTAIVHTVDVARVGNRESDIRNKFTWPVSLPLGNFASAGGINRPKSGSSWADLEFVQKASGLPVIVKGVLRADDAAQAIRAGAGGLWLSNHGGRQLDGAPSAFTVLPAIAEANAGKVPLIIDGGIRRGQDVFKAIALGANAVAIGRPTLYGLALGGANGVAAVYQKLTEELQLVMHLAGVANLARIRPDSLL
jgi:L-lactate oxidase